MRILLCLCFTFLFSIVLLAQESPHKLRILLLDADKKEPLPFASVVFPNGKGTVSNEKGFFAIDLDQHQLSDTIDIQYVGYKSIQKTVAQLRQDSLLFMKEYIVNLNEIIVFSAIPDIEDLVDQILDNFEKNYPISDLQQEVFIRKRDVNTLDDFELKYKKSSIEVIDKDLINKLSDNVPKKSYSYSDFLGKVYSSNLYEEKEAYKLSPIRLVTLQEENLSEMKKFSDVFNNTLKETAGTEYWKFKTGIISTKMDVDTSFLNNEDSTLWWSTSYFKSNLYRQLEYLNFDEQDFEWEFLHKPKRYDYNIVEGTTIEKEPVYIIDFKAKEKGTFDGRMYVSTETYAILRADYQFAPGKEGASFGLFGIKYEEKDYRASINYERLDSIYVLKYFSKQAHQNISFDRKIAFIKKQERKLKDKKVDEVKLDMYLALKAKESFELLVVDRKPFDSKNFDDFLQTKKMEAIPITKFDDNLWKGYSIIEPTQMMREYQKME